MKILFLSPHADDEVLGGFSFLTKDTTVIYFGIDEAHINSSWIKKRPSFEQRNFELLSLARKLGFKFKVLDNKINSYVTSELIPSIEKEINEFMPDIILLPNPTYNQDHRAVYEASLVALRPHDINFFVKKVLIYEQVQDFWNHNCREFNPNYFKDLNIEDKLESYEIYASQVRSFRSSDMLKALAILRGSQSNKKFAEAFEVLRWID
jgi:LmbE family N-acetylglucosaminyl deacetylase